MLRALYKNFQIFTPAYDFFRIDLFYDKVVLIINMVRFALLSGKTVNSRQKKRYASRLETTRVIKIQTGNGRVQSGIDDKYGSPTVKE
jgi:hypothetical protein